MTLQRLLACFLGLMGLAMIITTERWLSLLFFDEFTLMLLVLQQLLIVGFLLFQRMQIARWILGRYGDLPAHLDCRGLLAVGAATVGMFFLVRSFQAIALMIALNGWVLGGELLAWALRHYGLYYGVGAVLTVSARWLPMWVGWGRLDDARPQPHER